MCMVVKAVNTILTPTSCYRFIAVENQLSIRSCDWQINGLLCQNRHRGSSLQNWKETILNETSMKLTSWCGNMGHIVWGTGATWVFQTDLIRQLVTSHKFWWCLITVNTYVICGTTIAVCHCRYRSNHCDFRKAPLPCVQISIRIQVWSSYFIHYINYTVMKVLPSHKMDGSCFLLPSGKWRNEWWDLQTHLVLS